MTSYNNFRYPSDYEAKKAILEVGKRMYNRGFVASNDGNISCKVSDSTLWTTPTGVSKGYMTPDMLVKVNLDGKVLMGKSRPSSELKMHLRVYRENEEVMAVTHAHPPIATSFAIAGISLDRAILPEAVVNLGSVPIAHYATPGSVEVPNSIAPYCKTYNAVLLANHGALSWGKDVLEAYHRLESLEYYATVLMYTGRIIGNANELSCKQVSELIDIREKLGITSGGVPPCAVEASNTQDVIKTQGPIYAMAQSGREKGQESVSQPTYVDSNCGCSISIRSEQPTQSGVESNKKQLIEELTRQITDKVLESLKR